jgi:DNA-binding CsgD family transcriptional regulator
VELDSLLLALYGASREARLEEFQDKALNLLKSAVPFDSGIWGTGFYTSHGLGWNSVHLHNEPAEILEEHEQVKDQDAISFALRPHRTNTKAFHSPTILRGRGRSAIRDYTTRFGHQNALISSEISQETGYAYWVSLYRADRDRHYTERERQLVEIIAPHLREALRINRMLQVERLRGTRADAALAIVDKKGALYHTEPAFTALLQCEWEDWNGGILLPPELCRGLSGSSGRYTGRSVVVWHVLTTDMMYLKARRLRAVDMLSRRELVVARHVAQGLSHKAIAARLGTAPQTVRNQIQTIHDKLGVHNVAEIIAELNLAE